MTSHKPLEMDSHSAVGACACPSGMDYWSASPSVYLQRLRGGGRNSPTPPAPSLAPGRDGRVFAALSLFATTILETENCGGTRMEVTRRVIQWKDRMHFGRSGCSTPGRELQAIAPENTMSSVVPTSNYNRPRAIELFRVSTFCKELSRANYRIP